MESSSSGRLLMLCLVMLLFVALASSKKDSNDICKEKDKPGFKLNLTGAMIFTDHIQMIDSNLVVYKVPKSKYDGSYGKMVLDIKGIPIEEYWPKFATNSDWTCIKLLYKSIYHLINKHTKEILINILVNKNTKCMHGYKPYSLGYNLNTEKFFYLKPVATGVHEQFYIDTGLKIYSIEPLQVKFPLMLTWRFNVTVDNQIQEGEHARPLLMYYLVSKDNSSSYRNVSFYRANDFSTTPEDPPAGYHLENITDWHLDANFIPVGYLFKGSFYLYALDKLIIFEDMLPSFEAQFYHVIPDGKLVASTKMTVIKMSDFIQCDSEDNSTVTFPPSVSTVNSSKTVFSSTASSTLLIVIIASVAVLLILIVAGITIYCLCFGTKKKNREKQSKKKDSKQKKPSLASSSVATAGSKVSRKVNGGGGGSKMAAATSKAASSTSAAGGSSSKAPQSKLGKKNK